MIEQEKKIKVSKALAFASNISPEE